MKVTTVIGARPQFIKAAPISQKFREIGVHERLLHTGQHYDENMSAIFFDELQIPEPVKNLGVVTSNAGAQTGRMLEMIEEDLIENRPDVLIVYGDTNSTLAGALAASKMDIPIVHVEAGLRSFDKKMPEEQNRVLVDHLSELLLCPTNTSVNNLAREGIEEGVHLVGDVMQYVLAEMMKQKSGSEIANRYSLTPKEYYVATIHRAENTASIEKLFGLVDSLGELDREVIFPIHPRTKKQLQNWGWTNTSSKLRVINPIGYADMIALVKDAKIVLTDSGGLQKEAAWLGVPCVTMRETTEWDYTVKRGMNILVGNDKKRLKDAVMHFESLDELPNMNSDHELIVSSIVDNIINFVKNKG